MTVTDVGIVDGNSRLDHMPQPLDYAGPPPPPSPRVPAGCVGGCLGAIVGGIGVPFVVLAILFVAVQDPGYPAILYLIAPIAAVLGAAAGAATGSLIGERRRRRE